MIFHSSNVYLINLSGGGLERNVLLQSIILYPTIKVSMCMDLWINSFFLTIKCWETYYLFNVVDLFFLASLVFVHPGTVCLLAQGNQWSHWRPYCGDLCPESVQGTVELAYRVVIPNRGGPTHPRGAPKIHRGLLSPLDFKGRNKSNVSKIDESAFNCVCVCVTKTTKI